MFGHEHLTVEIGTPGTTTPSTVDLRGVTGTDPGHFSGSMVYVYGPLTFLGSPVSDYVYTASGVLHGYGGADSLSGGLVAYGDVSVPAMIYGDDGNDRLACEREGNCVLDGGLGNDVFAHWGRGSSTGGPGDDVTSQSRVPFDGGDGTDWVLLGNDSHLKVTAVAGTTNSVKIASDWATYTAKAVERVKFSATGAVTATMSPGVRYVIDICSYPNTLTVRVPAATWTQTDTLITAPGLAKVLLVTFFPCAVDPAAVNVVGV